jgi:hypothetical protein
MLARGSSHDVRAEGGQMGHDGVNERPMGLAVQAARRANGRQPRPIGALDAPDRPGEWRLTRHVEILWWDFAAAKSAELGPNFASDTSSACNESALVIWCYPIMEMEQ